jgi:hypothetical protein
MRLLGLYKINRKSLNPIIDNSVSLLRIIRNISHLKVIILSFIYNIFHHQAVQPIKLPKICQALTIYSISFMPQLPNALLLEYKGRFQLALQAY